MIKTISERGCEEGRSQVGMLQHAVEEGMRLSGIGIEEEGRSDAGGRRNSLPSSMERKTKGMVKKKAREQGAPRQRQARRGGY